MVAAAYGAVRRLPASGRPARSHPARNCSARASASSQAAGEQADHDQARGREVVLLAVERQLAQPFAEPLRLAQVSRGQGALRGHLVGVEELQRGLGGDRQRSQQDGPEHGAVHRVGELAVGDLGRGEHVEGGTLAERVVGADGELERSLDHRPDRRVLLLQREGLRGEDPALGGGVSGGEGTGSGQQPVHLVRGRQHRHDAGPTTDQLGRAGEIHRGTGRIARAEGGVGGELAEPQRLVAELATLCRPGGLSEGGRPGRVVGGEMGGQLEPALRLAWAATRRS